MHEAMSMDLAVEQALKMTNREDTLIIVTADHGHTMEMSGYQSRGSDIRGTNVLLKGLLEQYSKYSYDICPQLSTFVCSNHIKVIVVHWARTTLVRGSMHTSFYIP